MVDKDVWGVQGMGLAFKYVVSCSGSRLEPGV